MEEVKQLELSWQTTSIAPVLMSFGAFMLIRKITCARTRIYKAICDVSAMSYGMYLMHMLILPYVFGICNPVMSPPLAIFATAIITYVVCYIIAKLISLFKFGKYIVG